MRKKLKEWSKSVRARDDDKCILCGTKHNRLNAHHLLPKELYPQFKFELMNGVSLCPMNCHRRKAHWDGIAFSIWLRRNKPDQYQWVEDHCYL